MDYKTIKELINSKKNYVLKAIGVRNYDGLTFGKNYTTVNGIEEGIFEDRPFVTVIDDYNKLHSCHFSRFELIKEVENV